MKRHKTIKVTIDGKETQLKEGATILEAARELDIYIPTLCHHEALEPYGACRVCQVEIITSTRSSLITACTYPIWDGLIVKTDSEKVRLARKFMIELLLARCPKSEKIQKLAKDIGAETHRLKTLDEEERCILCGLCVRVCKDMIGKSAISFVDRGADRKIDTPFADNSLDCIGCGACVFVCPTGAIKMVDKAEVRKIHDGKTQLELASCKCCGARFTTIKELDHLKGKIDMLKDILGFCENCRRKKLKDQLVINKGGDACQR